MIVWINETFYIKAEDGLSFTLVKRGVKQSGKHKGDPTHTVLGYYSTLQQSVNAALNKNLLTTDEEFKSVFELQEYLKGVEQKILKACECVASASQASYIHTVYNNDELQDLLDFDGVED